MHRSGIGGFQNFDAAMMTPQIVEKRLAYMTPEWKDAFKMTTHLADSLKLEMAIAGSPGWSETGGPWVPKEDGMKKPVWTELRVSAGQKILYSRSQMISLAHFKIFLNRLNLEVRLLMKKNYHIFIKMLL